MSELFHFLKILNNLSMNWEKYDFHWEEWNFQPIANSAHTIRFLALGNENTSNTSLYSTNLYKF